MKTRPVMDDEYILSESLSLKKKIFEKKKKTKKNPI